MGRCMDGECPGTSHHMQVYHSALPGLQQSRGSLNICNTDGIVSLSGSLLLSILGVSREASASLKRRP